MAKQKRLLMKWHAAAFSFFCGTETFTARPIYMTSKCGVMHAWLSLVGDVAPPITLQYLGLQHAKRASGGARRWSSLPTPNTLMATWWKQQMLRRVGGHQ